MRALSPSPGDDPPESAPLHRQVRAFVLRSCRRLKHDRSALFWTVAAPMFYYAFFGLQAESPLARASTALVFGVFGALAASMFVFASNLGTDLRRGRYRKLRAMPVSPWADLVGRYLAGLAFGFTSFTAVLVVGLATGARFGGVTPLSIAAVVASLGLLCLIGTSAGMLAASVVQNSQRINAIGNAFVAGLFFLTGYNGLDPGILPASVRGLVNVVPNSLATRLLVDALLPAMQDTDLVPPPIPSGPEPYALLAAYVLVLTPISAVVMRRVIYDGEAGE